MNRQRQAGSAHITFRPAIDYTTLQNGTKVENRYQAINYDVQNPVSPNLPLSFEELHWEDRSAGSVPGGGGGGGFLGAGQQQGSFFGNNQQQQQGGSFFGSNNNNQQQQQTGTGFKFGGGAFGGGGAGGSFFGNNNQQQQQQQQGTAGGFFNKTGTGTGFQIGGGAFNKPAGTGGFAFGQQQQQQASGGGLFGNNANNQQQQQRPFGFFGNNQQQGQQQQGGAGTGAFGLKTGGFSFGNNNNSAAAGASKFGIGGGSGFSFGGAGGAAGGGAGFSLGNKPAGSGFSFGGFNKPAGDQAQGPAAGGAGGSGFSFGKTGGFGGFSLGGAGSNAGSAAAAAQNAGAAGAPAVGSTFTNAAGQLVQVGANGVMTVIQAEPDPYMLSMIAPSASTLKNAVGLTQSQALGGGGATPAASAAQRAPARSAARTPARPMFSPGMVGSAYVAPAAAAAKVQALFASPAPPANGLSHTPSLSAFPSSTFATPGLGSIAPAGLLAAATAASASAPGGGTPMAVNPLNLAAAMAGSPAPGGPSTPAMHPSLLMSRRTLRNKLTAPSDIPKVSLSPPMSARSLDAETLAAAHADFLDADRDGNRPDEGDYRDEGKVGPRSPEGNGGKINESDFPAIGSSSNNNNILQPNPHAPKLTLPGYTTVPSLAELQRMTTEQLRRVDNFTIMHVEHGKVEWLDPVDVTDLDLDILVKFEPKSLEIYPDESKKPAVGSQLNSSARVTLRHCWPKAKDSSSSSSSSSSSPSAVPEHAKKPGEIGPSMFTDAELDKYERRLQQYTKQLPSARFVYYDRRRGDWTFELDHF